MVDETWGCGLRRYRNRLDVTAAERFNASAVLVNLALISFSDAQMVETQCWACEGYKEGCSPSEGEKLKRLIQCYCQVPLNLNGYPIPLVHCWKDLRGGARVGGLQPNESLSVRWPEISAHGS